MLAIVKTTGYRHFQRVLGFEKRLFLIGARSQAFGQIAERNDELARAIGLKTRGIFKCHIVSFFNYAVRYKIPASRKRTINSACVPLPLRELQLLQSSCRFSLLSAPPFDRGVRWSTVIF